MSERLFTVKSDRFSLMEENEYVIHGWLARGARLSAEADGGALQTETEAVYHFNDERYGGIEVRCAVKLPGNGVRKSLKLYAERQGEKENVFSVPASVIRSRQRGLQVYLDDVTVMRERDVAYITGWAASSSEVKISVREEAAASAAVITRCARPDVSDMYEECAVEDESGFNVRLSPVPSHGCTLEFVSEKGKVSEHIATGKVSFHAAKLGKLAKKSWRHLTYNGLSSFVRKVQDKINGPKVKPVFYPDWIRQHLPDEEELQRQRAASMENAPVFDVLTTASEKGITDIKKQRFAESLQAQTYKSGCTDDRAAEWILIVSEEGELAPHALFELASCIMRQPELRMIYSDSDAVDENGNYSDPDMKPDFAPDYLASTNYIGHFAAVRRDLADEASLWENLHHTEDLYDCWLRLCEKTDRIGHIPKVLYHSDIALLPKERENDAESQERQRAAVEAHYRRTGQPADVETGAVPFTYRTVWHREEKPLVSVLIPNKDHIDDLRICIQSLTEKTVWPDLEIIIIENNSEDPLTFEGYEALKMLDSRIRTVTYEGGFNFSKINNFGAAAAKGDYLFLLNNDTEALSDVITEMMGYCQRSDVGIVGARLYYGDNTIQHAGVVLGWGGVAGHAFVNQKRGAERLLPRIVCQQNYSAVTAACMMVDRKVFEKVGGLSEDLAVAFNDIDFCMKVREAGYLIVYDPYAEMYHYESKSRGLEDSPEKKARFQKEIDRFQEKWGDILRKGDPYYNPHLSMITQDFSLKEI